MTRSIKQIGLLIGIALVFVSFLFFGRQHDTYQVKIDTDIPTAGFDEWYIFAQRPSTIKFTDVYINHSGFNLSNKSDLPEKFWQDIERNQPINYVAEGDSLIIVTADNKLKQDIEKYWC